MVPTAEIDIDLHIEKKHLNNIQIQWSFSDMYTSEILTQYEQVLKNRNDVLDKKRVRASKKSDA